ncbi:hypothetical protein [Lysobacter gummosus]|uniref:hypothetical protein n=1 Tax=Lysobacter gummosus TaxID=262324 RepID=UPI003632873D
MSCRRRRRRGDGRCGRSPADLAQATLIDPSVASERYRLVPSALLGALLARPRAALVRIARSSSTAESAWLNPHCGSGWARAAYRQTSAISSPSHPQPERPPVGPLLRSN